MSISLLGPSGAYEFPWIRYALLRDNILHHLEQGAFTTSFGETYKIGTVLGGAPVFLSANQRPHFGGASIRVHAARRAAHPYCRSRAEFAVVGQ